MTHVTLPSVSLFSFLFSLSLGQPAIVDRTLALVSGRALTLSDAQTAVALGLVEGDRVDASVVQRLVDRELMLREAERYQPPEPLPSQVNDGIAAATARAGGDDALARTLAAGGFTADRLRVWIRDDLRVQAYLRQRFVDDERRADLIADWVSDLRRRAEITVFDLGG
jgi:hypothetical protein